MSEAGGPRLLSLSTAAVVGRVAAFVAAGVFVGSMASAVWDSDGTTGSPAASPSAEVVRPPVVAAFDDMGVEPSPTLTLNYASGVRYWKDRVARHANAPTRIG